MALKFTVGNTEYLIATKATDFIAEPLTMVCWFKKPQVGPAGTSRILMSICTNGGVARWVMGADGTDRITAQSVNSGATAASCTTTATYGDNVWSHAAATFSGGNSRVAILNGVAEAAETTSISVTGIDRVLIGARINTTVGLHMDGSIAEAALYSALLNADEIACIYRGTPPSRVRPSSLVGYWPLYRQPAPYRDLSVGQAVMVPVGAPTLETHPPVSRPVRLMKVGSRLLPVG